MARKIGVVTGTRADFGLLTPLIREISDDVDLQLCLFAAGMHLSPEFGSTVSQIRSEGFPIAGTIELLLSGDTPASISKAVGLGIIGFSDRLEESQPDILVILGDRFETFAAAIAALIAGIPVAHIQGGELTEGAVDDSMRHAITKMAYLHFTTAEEYSTRVAQLGEDPGRVFCVGAPGLDNVRILKLLRRAEIESALDVRLREHCFLVTFHSVTLEADTSADHFSEILSALDHFPEATIILTKPNADAHGRVLIQMIDDYAARHKGRVAAFTSLGQLRYMSLLAEADVVIGNSSSAILEAPYFRTPSVDVGDRQRGRLAPASVIHAEPREADVAAAIRRALDPAFRVSLNGMINPYGDGTSALKMKKVLKEIALPERLRGKMFVDLPAAHLESLV